MSVNGDVKGDSGYALEEVLFGGRLRHRRSKNAHFFQAIETWLHSAIQYVTSFLSRGQVDRVILIEYEPVTRKERWLSDTYVHLLVAHLKSGDLLELAFVRFLRSNPRCKMKNFSSTQDHGNRFTKPSQLLKIFLNPPEPNA